jgi:hypothetical protein
LQFSQSESGGEERKKVHHEPAIKRIARRDDEQAGDWGRRKLVGLTSAEISEITENVSLFHCIYKSR